MKFFPREQLLILFYEDWLGRPVETLNRVFRHIGVDPLENPVIPRENVSSRQPRWAWLHYRMMQDNALRFWAQRTLPLEVRDAITKPIKKLNLITGPKIDPALRAKLAVAFHEDLSALEALTQRNLDAWRC
ncbi:hypothetical protein [Methylomagnum sp.]